MSAAGWVLGRDYECFIPTPDSSDKGLSSNMRRLLDTNVRLVVAQTRPAAQVAVRATAEVPIVLGAYNGDLVREGIVRSLTAPGGNVTGTYYLGRTGATERFKLLTELLPGIRRVIVLMNPRSSISQQLAAESASIGRDHGLEVECLGAADTAGVELVFKGAIAARIQAVVTVTGADMYALREVIARAAWQTRIPVVMGSIGFPALGGLAKIGPDIPVLWRRMATAHVIPILEGKLPGDLPLVGLDEFELEINLTTAAHLGIEVLQSIQSRATRLIEGRPRNLGEP